MTVYLVGAGPGDPDLLTLRAARLLADADVVIHDRLVPAAIVDLVSPWTQRIDVGKDPNGSSVSQAEINELCITHGRRCETVVRLKGGDPFVFGRGGEEFIALAAAGISVEVVPGVTSAIAGPAAAAIPVTHRHVSSGFTVLTGHQDPDNPQPIDWSAAARLGTTLVILMGAKNAGRIAASLMAADMAGDTPVAIVESATTDHQRVKRLRLADLGATPIANPAIIVVGDVAAADLLGVTTNPAGDLSQPDVVSTDHLDHAVQRLVTSGVAQ